MDMVRETVSHTCKTLTNKIMEMQRSCKLNRWTLADKRLGFEDAHLFIVVLVTLLSI